jgi:hypothetical protein
MQAIAKKSAGHYQHDLYAGSGHPGGSLSAVEILTALYFKMLRHDPDPLWEDRIDLFSAKGMLHRYYIPPSVSGYCLKPSLHIEKSIAGSRVILNARYRPVLKCPPARWAGLVFFVIGALTETRFKGLLYLCFVGGWRV